MNSVIRKTAEIADRHDLGGGFFYTTATNGCVTLWHGDDGQAIQLAQRHPGTSGKDAATIARNLLAGA